MVSKQYLPKLKGGAGNSILECLQTVKHRHNYEFNIPERSFDRFKISDYLSRGVRSTIICLYAVFFFCDTLTTL